MSYEKRKELIEKIQNLNESKLLVYFLSDRAAIPKNSPIPINANIGQDAKIIIYDSLKRLGMQKRIDLFIYTRGGDTNAVWPMVSLIKEFCEEFRVMVPFRNHSAGTMIALGADKILMSKLGELSPIDPTTGNQFNPIDEATNRGRKGISVEDLNAYLSLARERFELKDNVLTLDVFKELTKNVHPLALGNVNRVLSQSKLLSEKLLCLHLDKEKEESRINSITDALTVQFFSHLHFINRTEAEEILGRDIVERPSDETEDLMMELFEEYSDALKMRHDFCFYAEMGDEIRKEMALFCGLIENEKVSFGFKTDMIMHQRSEVPPNININLQPGQVVPPIIQGLPRNFYWDVRSQNWCENKGEV